MPYRLDPQGRLRERERLLARMRELEGEWAQTFFDELGAQHELEPPREDGWISDDVDRDLATLATRVARLDAVDERSVHIELAWARIPAYGSEHLASGERRAPPELERAFDALRGELDARLHCVDRAVSDGHVTYVLAVTPLARGAPRLLVRAETLADDLRRMIGASREPQLGDDAFDGAFFVEASERDARAVLSSDVRRAMVRIGQRGGVPHLTMADGRAVLDLGAHDGLHVITRGDLLDAVTILRALRASPVRALRVRR